MDVVLGPGPDDLGAAAARQFGVLPEAGPSPAPDDAVSGTDLVLDSLVGYALTGPLRGRPAALVDRLDGAGAEVRSLDVPSDVNATTVETLDREVAPGDEAPRMSVGEAVSSGWVFGRAGVDYEWPYGDGVTVDPPSTAGRSAGRRRG